MTSPSARGGEGTNGLLSAGDSVNLRIGCLNLRGVKSNRIYLHNLLDKLDICAVSEHWLHSYELHLLQALHDEFYVFAACPAEVEDSVHCVPRLIRGAGGVALFWRKSLFPAASKLTQLATERIVGIRIPTMNRPICFLSVYLPTRTGGTDIFKDQMDLIEAYIGLLSDCDVVILGDINADPGSLAGPYVSTCTNEQGTILWRYLERWGYLSAHLWTAHAGLATHTYVSEAHSSCSTIDHILLPGHMVGSIGYAGVLDEQPLNLSDHLPVLATLSCSVPVAVGTSSCRKRSSLRRCRWNKMSVGEIADVYTTVVERRLGEMAVTNLPSVVEPVWIEELLSRIVSVLVDAGKAIQSDGFRKHLKPRWSKELSAAHNSSKIAYRTWVRAGRPTSCTNPVRMAYKEAKKGYRRLLRKRERAQLECELLDLDRCCSSNPREFFRKLKRYTGGSTDTTRVLKVGGRELIGEDVLHGWKEYFFDLACPGSNCSFDEAHKLSIEEEYLSIKDSISDLPVSLTFSVDEVKAAVQSLKCGKAAGRDGIDAEHLVYGGGSLVELLTVLFNGILAASYVPSAFRCGKVIPIPKGHNKDLSNPSNFRGITILSNVSKVLEKLILDKILSQESPPSLNPLQGGFQPKLSCLHTALVLQEGIQHVREAGMKAFVAFLDVRKAFDTVWHKGLLVKAFRKGVLVDLWKLIDSWYDSSTSAVLWGNRLSEDFSIAQGVRQGGFSLPSSSAYLSMSFWTYSPLASLGCLLVMSTVVHPCMPMIWLLLQTTLRLCSSC